MVLEPRDQAKIAEKRYEVVVRFRNCMIRGYETFSEFEKALPEIREQLHQVYADRVNLVTFDDFLRVRDSLR